MINITNNVDNIDDEGADALRWTEVNADALRDCNDYVIAITDILDILDIKDERE